MSGRSIILIPALNPDETLVELTDELMKLDLTDIIVVNDGSDTNTTAIFRRLYESGITVVHHTRNLGKGEALKTGIRTAIDEYGPGISIITADADGQHLPEDIRRVALSMEEHPGCLVLGIRDFDKPDVPGKSRYGNKITSIVFRLISGKTVKDTQTGLRGIPSNLLRLALQEEGSRYEYEMNFLQDAVRETDFIEVPIATVYRNENRGSHFRPFRDSIRIYARVLRFGLSSLISAGLDYVLFILACMLLQERWPGVAQAVFTAAVLARLGSGLVNFLLNKYWSFKSKGNPGEEAVRYGILFILQMITSAGLVTLVSFLIPYVYAKLIVDSCLFILSFFIQKRWVFNTDKGGLKDETFEEKTSLFVGRDL